MYIQALFNALLATPVANLQDLLICTFLIYVC
jgi:hypothetical protein